MRQNIQYQKTFIMGKQIGGPKGVTEVKGTALEELTGETQREIHLKWILNKVNKKRLE